MNPSSLGKFLIIVGAVSIIFGAILIFSHKFPFIGRLPGDIYIQRKNFSFYFPLSTSILVSAIVTLLLWFFFRR
jgi:hypothetical protein